MNNYNNHKSNTRCIAGHLKAAVQNSIRLYQKKLYWLVVEIIEDLNSIVWYNEQQEKGGELMYYEPEYFSAQEFFSKDIWDQEHHKGSQIWRLMDGRILWTADEIRKHFCGPKKRGAHDSMTINNWSWGGQKHYSGYRDIYIDIVYPDNKFSKTSQHCFGRAMDYVLGNTTPDEIQADIVANPNADRYKYITGLELETKTWTHNDTRCWDRLASGIFTFTP